MRQQCPLGQKGIEIRVDDGGDYSETGELPYGTLLFNVIENGQPRWEGSPFRSSTKVAAVFSLCLPTFRTPTTPVKPLTFPNSLSRSSKTPTLK